MAGVGGVNVPITGNSSGFKKAMSSAQAATKKFGKSTVNLNRKLKNVGKSMTKMGKSMSMSLTAPIAALGAVAVKSFEEQIAAEKRLEDAVGGAADALKKQAAELQKVTRFGDEATMAVQGQLATLGLNEQQILKLTPLIQDLSARTGKDLTRSAKEVTSALSTGATTLAKYGVELNATNTLSENLEITVAGLTKEVGGQAQVLADEGIGPLIQMQNAMGDLMEQFGEIIAEGIKPFVLWIKALAERFQQLSPEQKKMIVIIGGLVAAIGPLLLAFGFLASTILPAVATGMSMVLGPIGLIVMAIAALSALIYTFWDEIVSTFMGAKAAIMKIGENIANGFRKIPELMFEAWIEFPKAILDSFKDLGSLIKAVITGDFEAIPGILKSGAANVLKTNPLGGLAIKLGKEFGVGVADEFVTAFQGEMKSRAKEVEEVVKLPEVTTAAGPTLPTAPSGGGGGKVDVTKKINEQAEAYKKVRKSISDAVTTARLFGDEEVTVAKKMDIVRGGIESAIIKFGENSKVVQALKMDFDALGRSMTEGIDLDVLADKIMEVINGIAMVMDSFSAISDQMIKNQEIELENRYKKEEKLIKKSGKTEEQKEKALAKLNEQMEKKRSILAIKRAKAEKAQALMSAIVNTAAAVTKALITSPFLAITVGALGAAQIATIAAQPIPALAEGGLAFGETLSVVGDNPNARTDPEVIAPLSKLKDLISFDNINLTSTIRGEDIILVTNRTNSNRGFIQ